MIVSALDLEANLQSRYLLFKDADIAVISSHTHNSLRSTFLPLLIDLNLVLLQAILLLGKLYNVCYTILNVRQSLEYFARRNSFVFLFALFYGSSIVNPRLSVKILLATTLTLQRTINRKNDKFISLSKTKAHKIWRLLPIRQRKRTSCIFVVYHR